MENAMFTHKELCLLLQTICENELGVVVDKDIKSVRKKVDIFKYSNKVAIEKVKNKQGTTKVSVFNIQYLDEDADIISAYTVTL